MIGGYIVETPSFEKKNKYTSRHRRRTASRRLRRNHSKSTSSRNRRRSRRRVKKPIQKGGSDCVSYGFNGLSDGLGSAQYSLN